MNLDTLISIDHAKRIAKRKLPRMVFDFIEGAADSEYTLRRNRAAFDEVVLHQRLLRDVSQRDISTTVFGTRIELPVMLSPVGLARIVSRYGEADAARGAGRAGTIFALSTASSFSIEEVAAAAEGPLWFQLYLWRDRDIIVSFLERAKAAGYVALCVTVDLPIIGKRERDLYSGLTIPPKFNFSRLVDAAWRVGWWRGLIAGPKVTVRNFADLEASSDLPSHAALFNDKLINPTADWELLKWVRDQWSGPMAVKGVMTPEDAIKCREIGAEGLVVSNHGGRQLDGQPSTLETLPRIVDAVGDDMEVFLDSGIRRGMDVVKAIALGARAVMIGRPYLRGLAVGGAAGVERVLGILAQEIDRCLALMGRSSLDELDRSAVETRFP